MPETPDRIELGRYMYAELAPAGAQPRSGKTRRWHILNRGGGCFLAAVQWYLPWRRYVLTECADDTVWSADCLQQTKQFLERVNAEHRRRRD